MKRKAMQETSWVERLRPQDRDLPDLETASTWLFRWCGDIRSHYRVYEFARLHSDLFGNIVNTREAGRGRCRPTLLLRAAGYDEKYGPSFPPKLSPERMALVNFLLENGADPDLWAPLFVACDAGCVNLVHCLLEHKADPSTHLAQRLREDVHSDETVPEWVGTQWSALSPLLLACSCKDPAQRIDIIHTLIQHGAQLRPGAHGGPELKALLGGAWGGSTHGWVGAVRLLADAKADVRKHRQELLGQGADKASVEVVQHLLDAKARPTRSLMLRVIASGEDRCVDILDRMLTSLEQAHLGELGREEMASVTNGPGPAGSEWFTPLMCACALRGEHLRALKMAEMLMRRGYADTFSVTSWFPLGTQKNLNAHEIALKREYHDMLVLTHLGASSEECRVPNLWSTGDGLTGILAEYTSRAECVKRTVVQHREAVQTALDEVMHPHVVGIVVGYGRLSWVEALQRMQLSAFE